MEEKEFKLSPNYTVIIFMIVYWGYALYLLIFGQYDSFYAVGAAGILFTIYFVGLRPYRYVVGKRTVYYRYLLRKRKEVDLMHCETICDPVERFSEFLRRAHAIELYTVEKKRYPFFPKDRVAFVDAIVKENKRIHCTVQDYTDAYREIKKQERRERKKAQKAQRKANKA